MSRTLSPDSPAAATDVSVQVDGVARLRVLFAAATGTVLVSYALLVPAVALLALAFASWIVLGYTVPWVAVLSRDERPVLAEANGTWFIWVVASQSVAVAAATLEPHVEPARETLAIIAVTSWSIGIALYVASAVFVSLRLMLYKLDPVELDPPYWVSMGAVAITVVAGARIVEMEHAPMIDVTRDLVAGMSVVFWAFATWLIPVLLAAGVWRHFLRDIPLVYTPTLWSMVFPLGMYAVAGMYLGDANRLPVVEAIGAGWFWVALLAWVLVAAGMVRSIVGTLRPTAA